MNDNFEIELEKVLSFLQKEEVNYKIGASYGSIIRFLITDNRNNNYVASFSLNTGLLSVDGFATYSELDMLNKLDKFINNEHRKKIIQYLNKKETK